MLYSKGFEKLVAHVPTVVVPGILANANEVDLEKELEKIQMRKKLYLSSVENEWHLSQHQMEAVCLALLAHEKKYQVQAETPGSLRVQIGQEDQYLQLDGRPLGSVIQALENENVLDEYCGQGELWNMDEVRTVRMGFFLGDGAGFGKTRTLAALHAEYKRRGVQQSLFVCKSEKECNYVKQEIQTVLVKRVAFYTATDLQNCKGPPEGSRKTLHVLLVSYKCLAEEGVFGKVQNWMGDTFEGLVSINVFFLQNTAMLMV